MHMYSIPDEMKCKLSFTTSTTEVNSVLIASIDSCIPILFILSFLSQNILNCWCNLPSFKLASPDHSPLADCHNPFTTSVPSPLIHQRASGLKETNSSNTAVYRMAWPLIATQCNNADLYFWASSEMARSYISTNASLRYSRNIH